MVGVVPALVAALGFAAFQTINRRALSGVDVFRGTASVLGLGALLLVSLSLVLHGPSAFVAVPATAYGSFIAAGLVHFFCGWTLLGMSQLRLGAARAGVVVGTLPLFGALVAAAALDEPLTLVDLLGLLLVVGGVGLVIPVRRPAPRPRGNTGWGGSREGGSREGGSREGGSREGGSGRGGAGEATRSLLLGVVAGLATASLWSVSPVLIRSGLESGAEPITGAAIGQAAAAALYGVVIATTARRRGRVRAPIAPGTMRLLIGAAAAVAVAIWSQWTAYDLAPIAVVLAVLQFTPPLVVLLAALVTKEPLGDRAWRVWLGSAVMLVGALLLILW